MQLLEVSWETVASRPYVFVFFLAFLLAAGATLGRWRALAFLLVATPLAFLSEWVSIRWGFPYGSYHYLYENLNPLELVIGGRPPPGSPPGTPAGVPFFDSLSYSFLAYCAYALALFFSQPLSGRGLNLQLADTPARRGSFKQWALATFFLGLLDVVIDPVAHLGERWFLGKLYAYAHPGDYFGIPLSNFLGWWLVAGVIFLVYAQVDAWISRRPLLCRAGCRYLPGRALLGPAIYFGVLAFNWAVTFWLGEVRLGLTGLLLLSPLGLLFLARAGGRWGRASAEEQAEHRKHYPALAPLPLPGPCS